MKEASSSNPFHCFLLEVIHLHALGMPNLLAVLGIQSFLCSSCSSSLFPSQGCSHAAAATKQEWHLFRSALPEVRAATKQGCVWTQKNSIIGLSALKWLEYNIVAVLPLILPIIDQNVRPNGSKNQWFYHCQVYPTKIWPSTTTVLWRLLWHPWTYIPTWVLFHRWLQ